MFINTSDDSDLLTGAINDTTTNEFDDEPRDVTPEQGEETSTKALLDGFKNSRQEKQAPAQEVNRNDDDEADGQTELFNNGTITPKTAEADAE